MSSQKMDGPLCLGSANLQQALVEENVISPMKDSPIMSCLGKNQELMEQAPLSEIGTRPSVCHMPTPWRALSMRS